MAFILLLYPFQKRTFGRQRKLGDNESCIRYQQFHGQNQCGIWPKPVWNMAKTSVELASDIWYSKNTINNGISNDTTVRVYEVLNISSAKPNVFLSPYRGSFNISIWLNGASCAGPCPHSYLFFTLSCLCRWPLVRCRVVSSKIP